MATTSAPGFGIRIAIFVGGLLTCLGGAQAVPARPAPIALQNADGSVVMGRMFGDERLSWTEDLSGFAIAFDERSGSWNYAREGAEGRLVPTDLRAGRVDPSAAGLTAHLRPGADVVKSALAGRRSANRLTALARSKVRKDLGPQRSVKNLVILVQFSDQTPHFQPADFDPVFNGAQSSVRDFYREISYGQFDMTSVVVPWVKLPNPAAYYAYNDRVPDGRPDLMISDAVDYLNSQGFDFKQFDSNNDGYVDAVDIIHSGQAYENTGVATYIHSHYAPFDGLFFRSPYTHDGLQFTGYHTEAEYGPSGGEITQIGVICHETAHFFGAPDLYDYDYDSAGLGLWSLMAAGSWGGSGMSGDRPSHPDAYTRTVLGFATTTVLSADQAGVRLTPVEAGPNILRLDKNMPSYEHFLIEDRQRVGYDQSVPGSGLLIYHVDESRSDENDQNDYLVDLEQADGRRDLNKNPYANGDASDAWPTGAKKDFAPWSKPGSEPYPGLAGQPVTLATIWVTNITRVAADITFDLTFKEPSIQGQACATYTECASGFCVDGVCCDKACLGSCESCSKASGAVADGKCSLVEGMTCDDRKACTENDVCTKGVCKGTAKTCPLADACNEAGLCQAASGECLVKPKADGTGCDDGDPCTTIDSCQVGVCTGGAPRVCQALDSCHVAGVCARDTGECSNPVAEEGTACGERSTCIGGVCTEKPPEPDAGTPPEPPKATSCGNCASGGAGLSPLLGMLIAALAFRRKAVAKP
ncbi:MAG TPA: M6 family metalloprotease domain-containing protein [Myxococcales bacterium]|jgi:M6 family metalloprotease-like protein